MKIKYEDITQEQWDTYFAIEKASRLQDIKETLQNNNIKCSDDEIAEILERYLDRLGDDEHWYTLLISIINSIKCCDIYE